MARLAPRGAVQAQEYCQAHLAAIATQIANLRKLEEQGDNEQTIAEAFRLIHTIKGNSGFLQLSTLERLAAGGEELLAAMMLL